MAECVSVTCQSLVCVYASARISSVFVGGDVSVLGWERGGGAHVRRLCVRLGKLAVCKIPVTASQKRPDADHGVLAS